MTSNKGPFRKKRAFLLKVRSSCAGNSRNAKVGGLEVGEAVFS